MARSCLFVPSHPHAQRLRNARLFSWVVAWTAECSRGSYELPRGPAPTKTECRDTCSKEGFRMQLRKVRISNFKSVEDSNEFMIDRLTCRVGKNESGKTALLQALYRLNPYEADAAGYDKVEEYP